MIKKNLGVVFFFVMAIIVSLSIIYDNKTNNKQEEKAVLNETERLIYEK